MSTAGASASHLLGRRAWTLQDGRFSLLSEVMLAGLQLADWLDGDVRGVASGEEQSILFLDLHGFSKWSLQAPAGDIAGLLTLLGEFRRSLERGGQTQVRSGQRLQARNVELRSGQVVPRHRAPWLERRSDGVR